MKVEIIFVCQLLLTVDYGIGEMKPKFLFGMPNKMQSIKDWLAKNRSKRNLQELISERVVGGLAAEENKFPWIVYFHAISKKRRNGSDEYGSVTNFCGGSLIHPRYDALLKPRLIYPYLRYHAS